jgi:hypothetical protein
MVHVVRLKGGDPFILDEGEEIDYVESFEFLPLSFLESPRLLFQLLRNFLDKKRRVREFWVITEQLRHENYRQM